MKKETKPILGKLSLILGIGLLLMAVIGMGLWFWTMHTSARQAERDVYAIRALIPTPRNAAPESRQDNAMAVLSIDGRDFVGILEMPRYEATFPVSADWGTVFKAPCRFSGSIYDRTIQIGGTSQKGQFDFYRELSVGDSVFFTDMEGNRFSYTVTNIRYTSHADQAALRREEAALTLFIRNIFGFEYIIVSCNI